MPTTYASLEIEVRSLRQQRRLLLAAVLNLLSGIEDQHLEAETGLPKADCDILREIKVRALVAGISIDQPLKSFLQ